MFLLFFFFFFFKKKGYSLLWEVEINGTGCVGLDRKDISLLCISLLPIVALLS